MRYLFYLISSKNAQLSECASFKPTYAFLLCPVVSMFTLQDMFMMQTGHVTDEAAMMER